VLNVSHVVASCIRFFVSWLLQKSEAQQKDMDTRRLSSIRYFVSSLLPEEWMFDHEVDTSERCSIVGIKHKEKTILAQNIDMSKFYSGSQVFTTVPLFFYY